jgi:hypothetical protein
MARGRAAQDASVLEMALVGYELEKQKIDEKIAEIRARLSGGKPAGKAAAAPKAARRKRVLSPEARQRIALAQKKRWAKHRRAKKAA